MRSRGEKTNLFVGRRGNERRREGMRIQNLWNPWTVPTFVVSPFLGIGGIKSSCIINTPRESGTLLLTFGALQLLADSTRPAPILSSTSYWNLLTFSEGLVMNTDSCSRFGGNFLQLVVHVGVRW